MRLLDLFCGAGGASMGYHDAGFDEIVGIDIEPMPRYPFDFIRGDAMTFAADVDYLRDFDAIHASPPCQRWSVGTNVKGNHMDFPNYIPELRQLLKASGRPYVIENVEGAPLMRPFILCGTMFPGLRVIRHRAFESNVPMTPPRHNPKHPLVYTLDKRKAHFGKLDEWEAFVTVAGGLNASVDAAKDAMGISWMNRDTLVEALPPAYTEWIGVRLMAAITKPVPSALSRA